MMEINPNFVAKLHDDIHKLLVENAALKRQLAEREGYVLVPLEPTNEMLDATTDIEAYRDDLVTNLECRGDSQKLYTKP